MSPSCARGRVLALGCVLLAAGGCSAIFDYPDPHDESGSARCQDGADNDFDGDVDHDDADCASPETGAACRDGQDNDLDRKVDQLDPDCATPETGAACRDGQDNDLDRKVDQLDPDCAEGERDYAACHDGLDNDVDGEPDERDPECTALWQERSEAACLDAEARDEDEDGRANCADPECGEFCPEGSSTPGTCADAIDNDADGATDCDDVVDCAGSCPEDENAGGSRCTDEVDNDGDDYVDGSDPSCWPLLAPEVQRCSLQGAVLDETFDTGSVGTDPREARWYGFGLDTNVVLGDPPPGRTARRDIALTLGVDGASDAFSGVGSRSLLSGNWSDFELDVSLLVLPDSALRLALVPVEQAPDDETPAQGTELLTITVRSTTREREATLEQGGRSVQVTTPAPSVCGQDYCEGGFERFSLRVDDGDLVGRFAGRDLPRLAIVGLGESAPRSRVVISGEGSGALFGGAYVDDLHAQFARSLPCGFFSPQVPSGGPDECALPRAGAPLGRAVSAAVGPDGYCALSSRPEEAPPPGQAPPPLPGQASVFGAARVQSWRSTDGDHWLHGGRDAPSDSDADGDLPLESAIVIGQAPAWDAASKRWIAGVAYHTATSSPIPDPRTWLQLFESRDCRQWEAVGDALALPEDAEPPSLVATEGGALDLYFTRPPTADTARTLWRLALGSAAELGELEVDEPVPVLELDPELHVDPPVSLQRVGADYVLGYRLDAASASAGLGVAVSDRRLREFRRAATWPLLRANAQVGFDDLEILSGTVLWREEGGVLLYAARGSQGSFQTIVGAGTALLRAAGTEPRTPEAPPPRDPPASTGAPSLLDAAAPWTLVAEEAGPGPSDSPARFVYVDTGLERLQYADVSFGASPVFHRSVAVAATAGDFELAFDLHLSPGSSGVSRASDCRSLIGIARGAPADATPPAGVFVELTRNFDCFGAATMLAAGAETADARWSSLEEAPASPLPQAGEPPPAGAPGECSGTVLADVDAWQRVTLRREHGTVHVSNRRDTPCGPIEGGVSTHYEGALADLDTMLVSGNACGLTFALRNLSVRSLRDVDACGDTLCPDAVAPVCVDLDRSPEHCGACENACGSGSTCVDGDCACRAGLVDCGTLCVVEDSPGHCGGCGLDPCGDGSCVFGACSQDVGESCADASVIPAGGGEAVFHLGDRARVPDHQPCAGDFYFDAAFVWTPVASGPARIEVSGTEPSLPAFTVLALSEDPSCGPSARNRCNDGLDGYGSELALDAVAGTDYFILVGSSYFEPPSAPLRLRVLQEAP